jgi:hypothetical protein
MKLDYLKLDYLKGKKEAISVALLGVSAVLGVLTLIKLTAYFGAAARAEGIVKEAIAQSKLNTTDTEKLFSDAVAAAGELKKKNLFVPPPQKRHPVNEVLGIMGSEALIGDRWYKVGDKIADAKVVAIEPAQVRIEWEGNVTSFAPINANIPSGPEGPGRGRAEMSGGKGPEGAAQMVNISQTGAPPGELGGGFGEPSQEDRARMMMMRARFENMSEEERQAFREQMRGRRGGGPGGGGPDGGGRRRQPRGND